MGETGERLEEEENRSDTAGWKGQRLLGGQWSKTRLHTHDRRRATTTRRALTRMGHGPTLGRPSHQNSGIWADAVLSW
jgi:hypothetical protein